jgi:hypothetical protein
VAGHTEKLFVGQESNKTSRPVFVFTLGNLHRTTAHPLDALRPGEQSLHEGFLSTDGDINIAIPHTGTLVSIVHSLDAVHGFLGIDRVGKFDIAIHGLASGPLHDNVDRPALGEVGITPEELNHLLTGDRVGNLYQERC